MNRILFFPLTKTNWPVMSRLAVKMEESGSARPVLVISNKLVADLAHSFNSHVEIIKIGQFQHKPKDKLIVGSGLKILIRQFINSIKTKLVNFAGLRRIFVFIKKKEILKLENEVAHVLDKYNPSAVVVAADRNSGIEPCVIKIARSRRITTVIPPIAFAATVEGMMIVRREHPGHIVTHDHSFKTKFPGQWTEDTMSHADVSFFSIPLTYAYSELGMLSPRPWVMGAGLTDWILADSKFVEDRYLAAGVPAEKIVITGHMDHDRVAASIEHRSEIRRILDNKYKLCTQKKIVVLPLTNWAEHNYMPLDWHWEECNFLCQVAAEQNVNILIPLHPTQRREDYLRLEVKHPEVRVLEEPLSEVLGVADVYFTGLGSSTVLWAVMAAIPVVIADHYHEKDHMHMGLPGVSYIQKREMLGAALSRLLNDNNYYDSVKNEQKKIQPYFGRTDGRSTQRIIEFICNTSVNPNAHPPSRT